MIAFNLKSAQSAKWRQRAIWFIIAVLVTAAFSLPLYWLIVTAFKSDTEIFQYPPTWVPHPAMFENFPKAIAQIPFFAYVQNSLIYATASSLGAGISAVLVGYGFAKIQWKGRDLVFTLVLMTLFLPYQVTMIPTYLIFKSLGWTNSLLPLIVPSFLGNAYFIFLMRQFIRTLPDELIDAARIDGCNEFGVLWYVITPLIRPALTFVMLSQFLNAWKDFLGPVIYLNDPEKYTLSLGLQQYQSAHSTDYALLMACATLFTVPLLIVFFFAQRYFIEGITLTGMKG